MEAFSLVRLFYIIKFFYDQSAIRIWHGEGMLLLHINWSAEKTSCSLVSMRILTRSRKITSLKILKHMQRHAPCRLFSYPLPYPNRSKYKFNILIYLICNINMVTPQAKKQIPLCKWKKNCTLFIQCLLPSYFNLKTADLLR